MQKKRKFFIHKFICYFFTFFVIITSLSISNFAKSSSKYSWPTLFTKEDFIPQNTQDLKQIEKMQSQDIYKLTEEQMRQKVFDSFYFFADFISSTKEEEPKDWFDSHKNPEHSLWAGFPYEVKRPPLTLNFPVFTLTKLAYFIANDEYTSKLNTCQGFWAQDRLQMAYDCFFFLQMQLAKDGVSISSFIRLQVNLVHGFFLLQLASNQNTEIKVWNAKFDPPKQEEYTKGDHYTISRALFAYVTTKADDSIYLPTKKEDVITPIYKEILNSPQYFRVMDKIGGKKATVSMLPDPVDSLAWVRTVMIIAYANTMTMNQALIIWERAFTAAEKLDNYMKNFNFPKMAEGSPLNVEKQAVATSEIFIAPKNNTDLLASVDLFRANAMLFAKDPAKSLEYIAGGITRKGHPEISSLLFTLSGNAYFDLDILRWARRSYSWAELYSKNFATKVPSSLFFGAESAYWRGEYAVAKKAYERFLNLVGDPNYGPWAHLRLAEISERQGNSEKAKVVYEVILKNFNRHVVADDAQVRLFCLYEKKLTKNTKKVEYKKVLDKIKNARDSLKKQAKACLLRADLDELKESSINDSTKNVVEKSMEQKKAIDNYAKEFPKSEFIVLFSDRIKELELSVGTFLASEKECYKLIDYYKKNRKELNNLSINNHHYVSGLKWDDVDRLQLLRCSAFVADVPIWNEMRKTKVGKDGNPLHNIFYKLSLQPSVKNALSAYFSLKNSSQIWLKKVKTLEHASFEITKKDDFWETLVLRELVKFALVSSNAAQSLLDIAVSQDLLSKPELIFSSNTFCHWMLRVSRQFTDEKWDIIAKAKESSQWLLLLNEEKEQKSKPCDAAFAKSLFVVSLTRPSPYRDKNILFPYLEKKGVAQGAEDWLQYTQRLEKERGSQDNEVRSLYRKLLKEAKEPIVKEAAGMWIKKNIPEEADKLLW